MNVGTAVGTDVGTNDGSLLSVGLRVGSTETVGSCVGIGDGMDVGAVDGVSVGKMVMFGLYIVGFSDGIAVGTDVGMPVGTADGRAINVGCAVCGYVGTFHNAVGIGKGPVDGVSVGLNKCAPVGPWVGSGVSDERAGGAQPKIKATRKCLSCIVNNALRLLLIYNSKFIYLNLYGGGKSITPHLGRHCMKDVDSSTLTLLIWLPQLTYVWYVT